MSDDVERDDDDGLSDEQRAAMAGETIPGKRVVVAGTPEHDRLLGSYPNATHYPDDVVVIPAPVDEEVEDDESEAVEDENVDPLVDPVNKVEED